VADVLVAEAAAAAITTVYLPDAAVSAAKMPLTGITTNANVAPSATPHRC
jgi:hypothetical protein